MDYIADYAARLKKSKELTKKQMSEFKEKVGDDVKNWTFFVNEFGWGCSYNNWKLDKENK